MIATVLGMTVILTVLLIFYFHYKNKPPSDGDNRWLNLGKTLVPLLLFFFIISTVFLLAKASLDGTTVCEPVINSTTLLVPSNVTSYTYVDYCITSGDQAPTSLFKGITWLMRIVYFLIFNALVFQLLLFFKVLARWKP